MALAEPSLNDEYEVTTLATFDYLRKGQHPPVRGSSARRARPVCIAASLGADLGALAVSALGAATVAGLEQGVNPSYASSYGGGLVPSLSLLAAYLGPPCVALAYLAAKGHYSRRSPFWTELQGILIASACAAAFAGCLAFLDQPQSSRLATMVGWLIFPVVAVGARIAVRQALAAAGFWAIRTIIVADPESARRTVAALESEPGLGYEVAAVVSPDQLGMLPPRRGWRTLMQQHDAGLLVLSYEACTAPGRSLLEALVRERVAFALMPESEGLPVLGFRQTRFFSHDTVMFTYRNNLASPVARLTKIIFDCAAALAGLAVLAPLMAVVALLVKLDGGPALYRHTRLGIGGRPFPCLKFRSMVTDGDAALRKFLAANPAAAVEWSRSHKLQDDPRVTAIGRFLRVTSLDELPQLFNVLRLEMSLVGPRPIVEAEVERYGEDIAYYFETRPGLTGLWQVSGRTGTSYAQRVRLDTWYVKNWTIWHDLAIIARTIPAVLRRQGAC